MNLWGTEIDYKQLVLLIAMTVLGFVFVIWCAYAIKKYIIDYWPEKPVFLPDPPEQWQTYVDQGLVKLSDYVDRQGPTYQAFVEERKERARTEIERRRLEVESLYVREAEARQIVKDEERLAIELRAANYEADCEMVKAMFPEEHWFFRLATNCRIKRDSLKQHQNLMDLIYRLLMVAYGEFGGKFPIKRTWEFFKNDPDFDYIKWRGWIQDRRFFEHLSEELERGGYLLRVGGRGSKDIVPDGLVRLRALTSESREAVKRPMSNVEMSPE